MASARVFQRISILASTNLASLDIMLFRGFRIDTVHYLDGFSQRFGDETGCRGTGVRLEAA